MLEFLKELKNLFNKNNIDNPKNIYSSILDLEIDEFTKLEIKEECTFDEYSNIFNSHKELEIPIRMFFVKGNNITNYKLKKQVIYIINNNNFEYFIITSDDEIKISQRQTINNLIHETILEIIDKKYVIHKYVHDLNHSTKIIKWYPSDNNLNKYFALPKDDALLLLKNLLHNLKNIHNIKCIITLETIEEIYKNIENDKIKTLSNK